MRVTQDLAAKAAKLLTEKTAIAIEVLICDIDLMANDAYNKTVPKELTSIKKSHPEWLYTEDTIDVSYIEHGRKCTYYTSADLSVISKRNGAYLKASKELRRKIIKLEKLKDKYKQLKKEAFEAIYRFTTAAHVVKAFPETASIFNEKPAEGQAPAATIAGLKSKLQKQ